MLRGKLCEFYTEGFEEKEVASLLNNEFISKIMVFVLGPKGTNISQASENWLMEIGVSHKSETILCETPEEEIKNAMEIDEEGVIPIFSLCAVYFDLCNLYFQYNTNYFFLTHYYMRLDHMQLASKTKTIDELKDNALVASHLSPSMLISNTNCVRINAKSNAHAAQMCADGLVDACITTEESRRIYNLNQLFEFGSPYMLFTFGTTEHGIKQLSKIIE